MRKLLLAALVVAGLTACSSDVIELDPSNWRCTNTITALVPITMSTGKSVTITYIPETECVQYTRKDQPK